MKNKNAFAALISLFFFWGFLAASNGIFIPYCKSHFHLNQFSSQLIDTSFYGAYFLGSLFLFSFTLVTKKDVLLHYGYKKTIVFGLLLSIFGACLMIVALNFGSFQFILGSFFIIALGFSFQQTAANPFAINLGNAETGAHRLNFAGGINSLGTTLGPLVVSFALFGKSVVSELDKVNASNESIQKLYGILACVFGIAAIVFYFTKMPEIKDSLTKTDQEVVLKNTTILRKPFLFIIVIVSLFSLGFAYVLFNNLAFNSNKFYLFSCLLIGLLILLVYLIYYYRKLTLEKGFHPISFPQLHWGMAAIFVYVGAEVAIQSNLGALLKTSAFGMLSEDKISKYISLYWGGLMIGRWTGAISIFNFSNVWKKTLTVLVPFTAFGLVLLVNYLSGNTIGDLLWYSISIVILIIVSLLFASKPISILMSFGALGATFILVGLFTVGKIAIFSIVSGGLFCSILWPGIFSLSIAGLKEHTGQASGFLIMMILGGAFIPPLQGLICDIHIDSILGVQIGSWAHFSYIVPLICFLFICFYAFKSNKLLIAQGYNMNSELRND